MTKRWSVSTERGVDVGGEHLVDILEAHHSRVIDTWQSLSDEQWTHRSRNRDWTVHDTARHVADGMQRMTAVVLGEPPPMGVDGFDPRSTPDVWLASSATDHPDQTLARYARDAPKLRTRVGERLAAGDDSTGATVYGPAHWSVMVVHGFWDSWLHERDTALPLGLSVESTEHEQRLSALYGMLMAMLPTRMMEQPFEATVTFTGPPDFTVTASHESGRISSVETPDAHTEMHGELCSLVDALSGRGQPVEQLLPAAPALLGAFASFMTD